jgi:hypothetical protein
LSRFYELAIYLSAYYVAYLGVARMLIVAIPQRDRYGLLLPTLIHVLILLAGSAIPFIFEGWRRNYNSFAYSIRQATNWVWTLAECANRGINDPAVMLVVLSGALAILLANLVLLRGEIEVVRVEAPERVRMDDLAEQPIPETVFVDPLSG